MVKKALLSIVIALGLLAPGSLATAQSSPTAQGQGATSATSIVGKWRGPLRAGDGTLTGLRVTAVIWRQDGVLVGRGWRSDGDCAGKLTFRAWQDGWAKFRQTITSGSCTPKFSPVRIQRRGERLLVRWYDPNTGNRAYMYAWRIS